MLLAPPAGAAGSGPRGASSGWSALTTPWTTSVSSAQPLPEYPRPQLQRAAWMNLNGVWEYEPATAGEPPPTGRRLADRILVPYPVGAPLSGVARDDAAGWYRRTFVLPASWRGERVLLNFGAVSWEASVFVNGQRATIHRGDYDAFSVDITPLLRRGSNELLVGYWDPVGGAGEPVGKQIPGRPFSLFHTASRGIWQTVWLEPVPRTHLRALTLTPDLTHDRLLLEPDVAGLGARAVMTASASVGGREVARDAWPLRPGARLALPIPRPHLWSPSDPFLYTLRVGLIIAGRPGDRATSYFGMRQVALGRVGGVTRILLNGQPLFQAGALDQGFWPDGLYTPPVDAAMRADISDAQRMGFNMLREHVKVQPDRWYMWADRLGLLVWQDMPNMPLHATWPPPLAQQHEFRQELRRIITQLRSHPSIVTWTPFNEGWGAFDVAGVSQAVHRLDPSRLVDADSGSASCCGVPDTHAGDLRDTHVYFGPFGLPPDARASVIGEYGGGLPIPGAADLFPGVPTSIGSPALEWSLADITSLISAQLDALALEAGPGGLSAAVFTELTATEQELGLMTYNRRRFLVSPGLMAQRLRAVIRAGSNVPGTGGGSGRPGTRGGSGARGSSGGSGLPPGTPPHGPDISWALDERTGNSASAARGGPMLTLLGGAGWTRGVAGSALAIRAAGELAATSGPVLDTTRSFSVSGWLRPSAWGQTGAAIAEMGPSGAVFELGIAPIGVSGRGPAPDWTFAIAPSGCDVPSCRASANLHYSDGRFRPPPGRWAFLTGVYDRPGNTITLYVNGLARDVEHVSSLPAASGPLSLGGVDAPSSPAEPFLGSIDDVRLDPRPLTSVEAWQLYVASQPAAG